MAPGEWILGRVRETLPPTLVPVWRIAGLITFTIAGLGIAVTAPERTEDYVRIVQWGAALYLIILISRIIWSTVVLTRREVKPWHDQWTKAVPKHIVAVGLTSILGIVLLVSVGIALYGKPGLYDSFPWLVDVYLLCKIIALNYIWQVQAARMAA